MVPYRFCVLGLFFIMVLSTSVTAADTMFRATPLHTGIFDNGGIVPVNTSAWRFVTGGVVSSSPAVANGIVYVGSDDKNLYAFDAVTGLEKWRFATGSGVSSSPAVVRGVVYIGSNDKNLYAIDAATGQEKWRFATGNFVSSSPMVSEGVVYTGSDDDHLHAIDAATGKEKWAFATESDISSSPAIAGGLVYIGSYDKKLYALNAITGKQQWLFRTRSYIQSSPAVSNGIVYVGSNDNYLYAVDAQAGSEKWRFATGGAVTSSPAVSNGIVYVGSQDTNLYAIDAVAGKEKWRFNTGSSISSSPSVANGVVYVGSLDGNLYAVDTVTGKEMWRYRTGSGVYSSPAVADGVVYVGSYDKSLYAVGGKSAAPVITSTEKPTTVITQPIITATTSGGKGDFTITPEMVLLSGAVVLLGGVGYAVIRQRRSQQNTPAAGPVTILPSRVPVMPPGSRPSDIPAAGPVTRPSAQDPWISPDVSPVKTAFGDSPPKPPARGTPAPVIAGPNPLTLGSDPFTYRLESIETRAAVLTVFRTPVDSLLFRSRDRYNRKKTKDAQRDADEAEAAIEPLKDCESHLDQWKKQGYDTTRLESLKTDSAENIYSAFQDFDQAIGVMERMRDDLESLKKQYPFVLTHAGFLAALSSLEQQLKKPDTLSVARSDLEQLKRDIGLFAQEQESRERHMRNDIIRIEPDITDDEVKTELKNIMKTIRSGDLSAAESLFKDLVSSQISRLNETILSLRNEGAVIPASLHSIQPIEGDQEYGDQLIEALMKREKLGRIREQFKEATSRKDTVTDFRLIDLYNSGNYEKFITEYKNQTTPQKNKGLIFISAKSEDFEYAHQVYTFLTKRGYNVFFSKETLPVLGKTEFGDEIDRALEKAAHLIVVTSKKEFVTSEWVKSEWRMFLDEKRAGRKPGNIITIIAGSMRIEDLPIGLRNYETKFLNDPKTLEQILNYLK